MIDVCVRRSVMDVDLVPHMIRYRIHSNVSMFKFFVGVGGLVSERYPESMEQVANEGNGYQVCNYHACEWNTVQSHEKTNYQLHITSD